MPVGATHGHAQRGQEHRRVAQLGLAAVAINLIAMDVENLIDAEKLRHRSFGKFLERAAKLAVRVLERPLESPASFRVDHGGNRECLAIGADFEWRIGSDVQQLEDGLVDDECVTVAVA
jgi:hypothetical protein